MARYPMKRMARLLVAAGIAASLAGRVQAQALVLGAGYAAPAAIDVAPGQVITIFARVPGKVPADPLAASAPLPLTLGGFSVLLRQTFPPEPRQIPILSVTDDQSCSMVSPPVCATVSSITVQIPYELTPNAPPDTVPKPTVPTNIARLEISYNGSETNALFLNPLPDRIHILNACDAAAGLPLPDACVPLIRRADGTLVTRDNAPQAGETLTASVVGLGAATTPVQTGTAAPQQPATVDGVLVNVDARANAGPGRPLADSAATAKSAQLQPGLVGIYQVSFTVPSLPDGIAPCSAAVRSNLTVNIGRLQSFDSAGICVDASAPQRVPQRRHE